MIDKNNNEVRIEQAIDDYAPIDLKHRKDLLVKWGKALESYDTPVDFVTGVFFKDSIFNLNGILYSVKFPEGTKYGLRKELMDKQKPYVTKQDYNLNMDLKNCFLCQNVAQSIDSLDYSDVLSNIVFDEGNYLVLPNRYPMVWGHSLWMSKNHDQNTNRVMPIDGKQYPITEGKHRGNILSVEDIRGLTEVADKHNLVAMRNHVLDAMSIPGHDHFHLMLQEIPLYQNLDRIVQKNNALNFQRGIYRSGKTPLDTLVISKDSCPEFEETASNVLKNMELDNQVFVLAYNKGNLLISPRINIEADTRIQLGAGVHVHAFDKPADEIVPKIKQYVPMHGEYNWKKYL